MQRYLLVTACCLGALAVAAGALGAHALEDRLAPDLLTTFATGARYHLVHAVVACVAAVMADRWARRPALLAGWLFCTGILVFSGSLYALALTGMRWLGAVTPVGGVCLIAGWLALGWGGFQSRHEN